MKPHLIIYFVFITKKVIAEPNTAIAIKKTQDKTKPPISLSAQTFIDLYTNSNAFVDKSLLIRDILRDDNKLILITRPRFWGKSINLDMMKTFLEIPLDKFGNPMSPDQYPSSIGYGLFVEHRDTSNEDQHLKKPLLIASEHQILEKYLCTYPVIYVDFGNLDANSANPVNVIKSRISDAYRKHEYMIQVFHTILNNQSAHEFVKKLVRDHLRSFDAILHNEISAELLMESLNLLSEILRLHYDAPVFVMIDEYDAPNNMLYSDLTLSQKDKDQISDFYANFLVKSLKRNIHLEKAILTGKLPLTIEDLANGLDGIVEYTFLNDTLMDYYGFNSAEINGLCENLQIPKNITHRANSRFGYYQFPPNNLPVYNPKFVASLLAENETDTWLDTRARENLVRFFASSDVDRFIKLSNLFRSNESSAGAEHLINVDTDCRHYSRHEIPLFYIGMTYEYDLSNFRDQLLKMNNRKFANKVSVFLYMLGHLSILNIRNGNIYLVHPAKNHRMRQRCQHFIYENYNTSTKNKN